MCLSVGIALIILRFQTAPTNTHLILSFLHMHIYIQQLQCKVSQLDVIDICCLKETKTTHDIDAETRNNRLILLPGQCRHYGLGFAISKGWKDKLVGYKTICDRIASETFQISKRDKLVVLNVYAPTQARSNKNESEREDSYDQLEAVLQQQDDNNTTLIIAGDSN